MTGGRILVAGASGRLGAEVLRILSDRAVPATRQAPVGPDSVMLDASGVADGSQLSDISAVINCAGAVKGTQADLYAANVTFAQRLARQARDRGVGAFVQVSSFAVFGFPESICTETQVAPKSAYGVSKAKAESRILALASEKFRPVVVRLPFMFIAAHPGLLGTMVKGLGVLGVVPLRSGAPTLRSMLTYAGAAQVLAEAADSRSGPILAAADPSALDLHKFALAVGRAHQKKIIALHVTGVLEELAYRFAPGLVRRILRSSVLCPQANYLRDRWEGWVDNEIEEILRVRARERPPRG